MPLWGFHVSLDAEALANAHGEQPPDGELLMAFPEEALCEEWQGLVSAETFVNPSWLKRSSFANVKQAQVLYKVDVKTASKSGSATSGNVWIELEGLSTDEDGVEQLRRTGQRPLDSEACNGAPKPFSQGQETTFTLEATDLGLIKTVILTSSKKWLCESVQITNSQSKAQWRVKASDVVFEKKAGLSHEFAATPV